jgi:hypothetical protein
MRGDWPVTAVERPTVSHLRVPVDRLATLPAVCFVCSRPAPRRHPLRLNLAIDGPSTALGLVALPLGIVAVTQRFYEIELPVCKAHVGEMARRTYVRVLIGLATLATGSGLFLAALKLWPARWEPMAFAAGGFALLVMVVRHLAIRSNTRHRTWVSYDVARREIVIPRAGEAFRSHFAAPASRP